ncbi:MAG: HAD family hydrolase [Alphaproteobacteria bacterium]|nr:HAD family hydrolase [Alphaproteobacteria bacterium]
MSAALLRELAWLPRPPTDFRDQLRAIGGEEGGRPGDRLRYLAGHALNLNQTAALASVLDRLHQNGADLAPLKPLRLALVGNGTLSFIAPALKVGAARFGFALELIETEYGTAAQEALNPDSRLNRANPDFVLLGMDWRSLPLRCSPGDAVAAEAAVGEAVATLKSMGKGIKDACGATAIFQTVARPAESLFGSLDFRVAGTARDVVDRFNRALVSSIQGKTDLLLDVAGLAETVGLADWHDLGQWYLAKLPFAQDFVPLYADHVARLLAAARGASRRCLVLDLDNTLWGGVIGDDGLAGIDIGQGSPVGEAHLGVQSAALSLRDRGIVLAVSSKNEDATARSPFQQHPDMLLRESHIAVFQANWQDKAANIRAIARSLALGLDAFVLLDDNPVERAQVRRALPEVAVPELPDDPALYARVLLASGYFESVAFSVEDIARASYYQANATRAGLLETSGDLDAFLVSLDMTISFSAFNEMGRERIAQLIGKSNQFNLTTRRYSAAEVDALGRNSDILTLQVRLTDRFGDNGMISVVICRRDGSAWEIDTWLMSCRVLGRRVEEAVLQELVRQARRKGISLLRGVYIPTDRNALVKDHYDKLGFALERDHPSGRRDWILDVEQFPLVDLPLRPQWTEAVDSLGQPRR